MAKHRSDEDLDAFQSADEQPLLTDSQFDLAEPDSEPPAPRKKGKPVLFLGLSLLLAMGLAGAVLYAMELGPFEPAQADDPPAAAGTAPPTEATPTAQAASQPVSAPAAEAPAAPSGATDGNAEDGQANAKTSSGKGSKAGKTKAAKKTKKTGKKKKKK